MQIWLYSQLALNILLIRVQINPIWFTFKFKKLLKWKNFMSKSHYIYFCTKWRKCLNSENLWKWEDLKRKKNCKELCAALHTIQSMLVHKNARNCSKMSKKMIRRFYDISSNEFYGFHRSADLQSSAFFWKLTVERYFNHLQKKVTPMNPHFCIFSVWS